VRSTILASKRARGLRREMSKREVWLWTRLRVRHDGQPPFRRQHPMGHYILDFFCPQARLVVEIDGQRHWTEEQAEHDARRDAWLQREGLTVYRIPASRVLADPDEVADSLRLLACDLAGGRRPTSSPVRAGLSHMAYGGTALAPLPRGRGRGPRRRRGKERVYGRSGSTMTARSRPAFVNPLPPTLLSQRGPLPLPRGRGAKSHPVPYAIALPVYGGGGPRSGGGGE
jgi:very-short-patch-repair endonuclease